MEICVLRGGDGRPPNNIFNDPNENAMEILKFLERNVMEISDFSLLDLLLERFALFQVALTSLCGLEKEICDEKTRN